MFFNLKLINISLVLLWVFIYFASINLHEVEYFFRFINLFLIFSIFSLLIIFFFKFLLKKNKSKLNSNYKVSIYINMLYLLLMIPPFIFMYDGLFCRYYFFSLWIVYIYFYKILSKKV